MASSGQGGPGEWWAREERTASRVVPRSGRPVRSQSCGRWMVDMPDRGTIIRRRAPGNAGGFLFYRGIRFRQYCSVRQTYGQCGSGRGCAQVGHCSRGYPPTSGMSTQVLVLRTYCHRYPGGGGGVAVGRGGRVMGIIVHDLRPTAAPSPDPLH